MAAGASLELVGVFVGIVDNKWTIPVRPQLVLEVDRSPHYEVAGSDCFLGVFVVGIVGKFATGFAVIDSVRITPKNGPTTTSVLGASIRPVKSISLTEG